jgi:hypothetical protein
VVGQKQLRDDDIAVSVSWISKDRREVIWTCVGVGRNTAEFEVLQIRDRDGAYRRPSMRIPSSLAFEMREELREKIQDLIRGQDSRKSGGASTPLRRGATTK